WRQVGLGHLERCRRIRRLGALLHLQRVRPDRRAGQAEGGEELAGIHIVDRAGVDGGRAEGQGRGSRAGAGRWGEGGAVDLDGSVTGVPGGVVRDGGDGQRRALAGGDGESGEGGGAGNAVGQDEVGLGGPGLQRYSCRGGCRVGALIQGDGVGVEVDGGDR